MSRRKSRRLLAIVTGARREETSNPLESSLSPGASLKHKSQPNLKALTVRDNETPPGETHVVIHWVGRIRLRGFVSEKIEQPDRNSNTLNPRASLAVMLPTKGPSRKIESGKRRRTYWLPRLRIRAFRIETILTAMITQFAVRKT
jgi:hypothetical protein